MTFTKAKIPIRINATKKKPEHVEFRDGYTFEAMFSTGTLWLVGVFKDPAKDALHKTRWVVSDIYTGYWICEGKTRKDAVKTFQERYLSALERKVMSDERWPHNDSFTNWYEYTSGQFGKLIEETGAQS